MRDIKNIHEDFVFLNRYKDLLEKKLENKEVTTEELNKINQDLKAVNELMKDLQFEVNEWASNYNKEKNNTTKEELQKEKTNKEKFYENRELLKQIKNKSKNLQPKITSQDKKRKDEILENAGFIETKTVDNRKIFIHPSLVGQYYDIVKEQRKLSEILAKEYREKIKQENKAKEYEDFNESLQEITEEEKISDNELEENINQENIKTLDEQIEDITKQINYILNEAHGRKMFVKYKGEKYYIPRAERGKFLTLMSELNRLQKHNDQNMFDTSNTFKTIEFIEGTNIPKPRIRLPYETNEEYENYLKTYSEQYYGDTSTKNNNIQDYLNNLDTSTKKDNEKRQKELFEEIEKKLNQSPERYYGEASTKNNNIQDNLTAQDYEKRQQELLEELEKTLKQYTERNYGTSSAKNNNIQTDLDNSIEKNNEKRQRALFEEIEKKFNGQQYNPNTGLVPYEPIEELAFIEGTSIPKPRFRKAHETDEEYEKYLENHYNKYKNQFKIKNVRKPKSKNKIKGFLKKSIAVALIAVTLITSQTVLNNHDNKTSKEQPKKTEQSIDNIINRDLNNKLDIYSIDDIINNKIDILTNDEHNLEELSEEENISEKVSEELTIGSIITLTPDCKIYKTAKDSILEENKYRPYYNNNNEERVILGVSIQHNGELINVFAHMDHAKEKIKELLNDGGTIESVLTGNIERETSLKKFRGASKLRIEEINDKAEGWYNINSVANQFERGYRK